MKAAYLYLLILLLAVLKKKKKVITSERSQLEGTTEAAFQCIQYLPYQYFQYSVLDCKSAIH